MESIGQIIKTLRLKAGFETLGQLYKVSNVTVATLSRIENNVQKPTPQTLKKLATHLDVSTEFLFNKAGYLEKDIHESKKSKDIEKFLEQGEIWFRDLPLTEAEMNMVKNSLEAVYLRAKQLNKRKKEGEMND